MFRGRYEHAIDGKGRTSLPSRFREVIAATGDTRIMLTNGLDDCVVVYPFQEWLAFEDRLAELPQFDEAVIWLRRTYVSGAVEAEPDKTGRVLIPATLRKHAGLRREAVWAGMGKYLELWDQDGYEAVRQSVLGDPARNREMRRRLAELNV